MESRNWELGVAENASGQGKNAKNAKKNCKKCKHKKLMETSFSVEEKILFKKNLFFDAVPTLLLTLV